MSSVTTISSVPGATNPAPGRDAGGQGLAPPRAVLAGLSGVACLAALQALALPRWPAAAPLAAPAVVASLEKAGFEVKALPPGPGQRSSELARGERLVIQLRTGASTATLQLLPAQVRQRANFQLALISRDQPNLALPPGLPVRRQGGSLAYVEGQLGDQQLRQTCLVRLPERLAPGPSVNAAVLPLGGVSAAQLGAAADQSAAGALLTLRRVLGLTPNRNFGCLLVSLGRARSGSGEAVAAAEMDRLWTKLLPALSSL